MTKQCLVVVPTLNAGNNWLNWMKAVKKQESAQGYRPFEICVIDSGSSDDTVRLAANEGFNVLQVEKLTFNHGGTRQKVVDKNAAYDIVVFLTQDAMLSEPNSLRNILAGFQDEKVAAICGRQLPNENAAPIEAHARIFNYPDISSIRSIQDVKKYGLKTVFLSNSLAAYRVSALLEVGGFPDDVIFGEDMYVAAKMLMSGYKVAYAADACIYHSHNYNLSQEFGRYFDMGVFHAREPWIRLRFGAAEGEGFKFLISEQKYLFKHAFWLIPEAMFRMCLRYSGFLCGLYDRHIPLWLKCKLSMNSTYFKKQA